MANPNEYNDEAFANASVDLSGDPSIEAHVNALWRAGATRDDIIAEFTSVVEDAIAELENE